MNSPTQLLTLQTINKAKNCSRHCYFLIIMVSLTLPCITIPWTMVVHATNAPVTYSTVMCSRGSIHVTFCTHRPTVSLKIKSKKTIKCILSKAYQFCPSLTTNLVRSSLARVHVAEIHTRLRKWNNSRIR